MKPTILVALAAFSLTAANPKRPLRVSDPVHFQGVGQVRMGMTLKEFKAAIGVPVEVGYDVSEECGFVSPKNSSLPIAFMIIKGKIVRTDFNQPGFRTAKGAKVGDSENRILGLYKGQVQITQHTYIDEGHYLTIKSKGAKYALVFETDGKVVTSVRIGLLPAAEYIEGCA